MKNRPKRIKKVVHLLQPDEPWRCACGVLFYLAVSRAEAFNAMLQHVEACDEAVTN